METLRVGDVLAKKMGGGTLKVEVVHIRVVRGKATFATLKTVSGGAPVVVAPIGEDGLPEGYRRKVAP